MARATFICSFQEYLLKEKQQPMVYLGENFYLINEDEFFFKDIDVLVRGSIFLFIYYLSHFLKKIDGLLCGIALVPGGCFCYVFTGTTYLILHAQKFLLLPCCVCRNRVAEAYNYPLDVTLYEDLLVKGIAIDSYAKELAEEKKKSKNGVRKTGSGFSLFRYFLTKQLYSLFFRPRKIVYLSLEQYVLVEHMLGRTSFSFDKGSFFLGRFEFRLASSECSERCIIDDFFSYIYCNSVNSLAAFLLNFICQGFGLLRNSVMRTAGNW